MWLLMLLLVRVDGAPSTAASSSASTTWRGIRHLAHFLRPPLPALDQLLTLLGAPGSSALELGCGEGTALIELQSRYPAARYLCINQRKGDCARLKNEARQRGAQSNSTRQHLEFACGKSHTSRRMVWLRTVGEQHSIPAGARLPLLNFGDVSRRMPLASASFDFIYSQV